MGRRSILVVIVTILSLGAMGVWAQTRRDPTAPTTAPGVISGENIGFRVTGGSTNGPVQGALVVKIDGRWVDAVSSPKVIPAGK
jgi:hypothetical protein